MQNGGGPLGGGLPGEVERASYHLGEVVLTDRRILHHGRGRTRHQSRMIHLRDITSVGIVRRRTIRYELLLVPVVIASLGLGLSLVDQDEELFFFGLMVALFSLPVVWFGAKGMWLRIAVPGDTLDVRVPRKLLSEARSFLQAIELAREPRPDGIERIGEVPTATPFGH